MHTTPNAVTAIAEALARRADSSWVTIVSSGTELSCAITTRSRRERDVLLLDKLPCTPQVSSVQAHCILHVFTGVTNAWHATRFGTPAHPPAADPDHAGEPLELDATDRALLDQFTGDGRLTVTELALATGRSTSSVQRRLEQLHTNGAISFTIDFDSELLGYHMNTRLWLRISPAHLRTVGQALAPPPPRNRLRRGHHRPLQPRRQRPLSRPQDLYRYLDEKLGPLPIDTVDIAPVLRDIERLTT
ncbi:Lrp/AsnC family transcriptional regulator [Streptomyces violascens]|uniref:Lrp/AsnC family transcriptional regulator n=1 Tax=Streptomyces violascens TaxID=67381 RepID=UPI0036629B62